MLSQDLSGYLHAARENPMRGFAMARQHWGTYATISLLLAACGAAFGQKARPAQPQTVHERIEELSRALQNNPRLKSLTESIGWNSSWAIRSLRCSTKWATSPLTR
jgi:hypothetical protein